MRYIHIVAKFILFNCALGLGISQESVSRSLEDYSTPPSAQPGAPAGSYPLSGFETVNLYSGKLSVNLPLLQIGARGSAGYTMYLPIDRTWTVEKQQECHLGVEGNVLCNPTFPWYWFNHTHLGLGSGELEAARVFAKKSGPYAQCGVAPASSYNMNQAATLLVFADAQGTQIELKDTIYHGNLVTTGAGYCPGTLANRGKVFTSRDGTSITFVSDTDIYDDAYHPGEFQVTGNLLFPDGTMYRIRDSRVDYIRDKDGNLLRFEYEPDPERRLLKIVDSLHREVSIEYTSTTRTIKYGRYGASGSNCGTAGFNCITVRYEMLSTGGSVPRIRDYSDPAARVKPLNVLFPLSTSSEDNDHLVVADVTWPNGKKHEFFYNNYSEVARIKLPTGGAFEYDWGKGVTKQNGADTPAGGLIDSTDAPGLIYRRVKKRRVYNESGVPQGETLYENNDNGETSGVADLIVTVRQRNASAQDIAVASHSFHDSPQEGYSVIAANQWNLPAWNEGKEFKVETTDPANPYNLANGWLQTEETQWWIGSPNAGQPDASNPLSSPYIRRITKRLPNSGSGELQTKTEFEYDSYNNETVRREYAFKNGTPDTVMRLTETQYLGGSYATSQQIHIRRLPTNIKVYGYPGSVQTLQSEKTYVYDETGTYATESCSSIPGHDLGYYSFFSSVPVVRDHYRADNPSERGTSYLARGLLTTAKRRVNGGGGWIETHAQYDVGGNIRKNWDGKNHPTTFSYPAGNCSFPSEVSTAVGGSTHTVSMQYDFNTGKMTQHTDPAGVATALVYEAALGRLSQVTNGHGTSFARTSTIAYNDNANTVTVTAPVADAEAPRIPVAIHAVTTTRYDGLGRVTETEQATGGSPVIVKTAYDALGRVASTSLPSDDGNYQYVAFAYDALDRRTKATNADGSAVRTCYAGDLAISRDEAGKWRQTKSDALGRLIEVVEDPAGAQCDGQTNSSSGLSYLTKYAYDAMDNLLSVDEGGRMRSFSYDWPGRLLSAANPESGTVNYVYDNNGNLTQKTDARGVVTSYTYDELNRPLAKTYSGGAGAPSVAWAWDTGKVGKLTSVDAATPQGSFSKTSYTYDAVGRIAASVQRTEGVDYPFEYRYYKGWGLRQVKYPSGRWVRYTPDAAGRAVSVEGLTNGEALEKAYWTGAQYAPQGALKQVTLGSSPALFQHTRFNARQQVTNIKVGSSGSYTDAAASDRLGITFSYGANNNGNVLTQVIQAPGGSFAQTYNYDPLNRLCSVREVQTTAPWGPHSCGDMQGLFGGESWRQTFRFDRFGNQWVAQHLGANMPYSGLRPTQQSNINAANNRLAEVANQIAFDAAGHQTRHGGWTLAYDAEGRIETATPSSGAAASYDYDGEGRRVKKTVGSTATWFVYNAMGELAAEYLASAPTGAAATHFVTTDHLGSTRLVTDANGNVVSRHDYLPFGEEIPAGMGGRTAGMGYVANPALTHRFTGKERDTETGLDYFGARYLSGVQGRFVSADAPFADQHVEDPQSWNLYAYVRNNPLRFTDPTGRDCFQGVVSCANYLLGGAGAVANAMSSGIINAPNRIIDAAISPFTSFRFGDAVPDAFTPTNVDQRQGMEAANGVMLVSPLAELGAARAVSATAAEVPMVTRNAAQGRAFQNAVAADTAVTDANVVQNISVRTQSGVRTQIDVVSTNAAGNVVLREAKSSATAPLTPNQAAAHPEIGRTGATVVGRGKPPYVGGTQIPPTQVQVVRPQQCPGGPGCPQ